MVQFPFRGEARPHEAWEPVETRDYRDLRGLHKQHEVRGEAFDSEQLCSLSPCRPARLPALMRLLWREGSIQLTLRFVSSGLGITATTKSSVTSPKSTLTSNMASSQSGGRDPPTAKQRRSR